MHAVLVDVRPEEVPEWDGRVEVVARRLRHARRASRWRSRSARSSEAKRAAERGEDAVAAARLAQPAGARLRAGAAATTAGPELPVEATKRWFAAARDGGAGRGSLTLIATARVEIGVVVRALVHEALEDSANMVVRLDPELAARGKYPAIDARALPHAGRGGAARRGPAAGRSRTCAA